MVSRVVARSLTILCVLVASIEPAPADRREILFPPGTLLFASPPRVVFAHEGHIGFTIGPDFVTNERRLYSFSIDAAATVDEYRADADFGRTLTLFLAVSVKTGQVIVFGTQFNGEHLIVALTSDSEGHLKKAWTAHVNAAADSYPGLAFNDDGTRIYLSLKDQSLRLFELQAQDGLILSSTAIPNLGLLQIPEDTIVLYDRAGKRPIVVTTSAVYGFANVSEGLRILWSTEIASGLRIFSAGLTTNGRFLLGYCGFAVDEGESTPLEGLNFLSLNLETRQFKVLTLHERNIAFSNLIYFRSDSSEIVVPYGDTLKIKGADKTIKFCGCGTRLTDTISIAPDGSLAQSVRVKLPRDSESLVTQFNNVVVTSRGTAAFLSTLRGTLFTFDTVTGEIVNEQAVPDRPTFIYLPGVEGVLLYAVSSNRLVLFDVSTIPAIDGVEVGKKQTIIKGANFLFGARVKLNGTDLGVAGRNPRNPGREIVIERGRKDFASGEELSLVVENLDGTVSRPFVFRR